MLLDLISYRNEAEHDHQQGCVADHNVVSRLLVALLNHTFKRIDKIFHSFCILQMDVFLEQIELDFCAVWVIQKCVNQYSANSNSLHPEQIIMHPSNLDGIPKFSISYCFLKGTDYKLISIERLLFLN